MKKPRRRPATGLEKVQARRIRILEAALMDVCEEIQSTYLDLSLGEVYERFIENVETVEKEIKEKENEK